MSTDAAWAALWWWWLLAILLSWLALELGSIAWAHHRGQRLVQEWTLSDTIRRWSAARRWLAPLVVGSAAFLLVHFFGMGNQ
ncbi:MAG TPA: hypothetical protein VFW46_21020 [Stellaceae bacterium]|nr:hypothetical protein [Stellaceae bacterium]